ncbi:hypothetical protein P43SY_007161 [Pythium insidiosum]|uniref:Uncharacterized protein n=1 Tax=Pythium insidiosum TaxID=114742 RepID=A0AAD5LFH8_PYTIN|nr:hypothetical protein P43SY_007161 [Pythium insidiosum]
MEPPVFLTSERVARGALPPPAPAPADAPHRRDDDDVCAALAVFPPSASASASARALVRRRVAVLTWSPSRGGGVRLGVYSTPREQPSIRGLGGLLSAREIECMPSTPPPLDAAAWSLVWSPDGRFLLVAGVAPRDVSGHAQAERQWEPAMWLYTHSEWLQDQDERDTDADEDDATPPLLVRVNPREYLTRDAAWNAAATAHRKRVPGIRLAFFPAAQQSSRCLVITTDGFVLQMEMQVADLLLHARAAAPPDASLASLFRFKTLQRLSSWHAGVDTAAFDSAHATLVLGGGIKDPSEELRRQRASSLTVWRVTPDEPFLELLDYTMVLAAPSNAAPIADDDHDAPSPRNAVEPEPASKGSMLGRLARNPLSLLTGGAMDAGDDDANVLRGRLRHAAISTDGVFVSLVDQDGLYMVRQIDVCADVVPWRALPSETDRLARALWLSSSMLAFETLDRRVLYAVLGVADEEPSALVDEEDDVEEVVAPVVQVTVLEPDIDLPVSAGASDVRAVLAHPVHDDDTETETALEAEAFGVFQMTYDAKTREWSVWQLLTVSPGDFMRRLIALELSDRALELDAAYRDRPDWERLNLDAIHQSRWSSFREETTVEVSALGDAAIIDTERDTAAFEAALQHLNAVEHDPEWVLSQCLETVASSSLLAMKEILAAGFRALMSGTRDARFDADAARGRLLRYMYRVDSLKELIRAELDAERDGDGASDEQCFDGHEFVHFRDCALIDVARQLAKDGRLAALSALFRRHAWNLLPAREQILQCLPVTVAPREYAHLLPAIGADAASEWQFHTLQVAPDTGDVGVVELELQHENRSHDLSLEELAAFEACAQQDPQQRRDAYALWFTHRMVELDSLFGQLQHAHELGTLAAVSLGIAQQPTAPSSVQSTPFEDFLLHSERLFRCVHVLQLSSCCLLTLEDWSLLSLHDQVLAVVDGFTDVDAAVHRLRVVFLDLRRHLFDLDEAISWLCQVLLSRAPSALSALSLCARLVHESNPLNEPTSRWIQDDARLLRTAIDAILMARLDGDAPAEHALVVEALWAIFQSLPARKDDDPPEIAQLQVEVDGVEDLLLVMDTLARYDVRVLPRDVRQRLQEEERRAESSDREPVDEPTAPSSFGEELVDRMCRHRLAISEPDAVTTGQHVTWMAIWEDAMKLKTHALGERLHQDAILATILRHLLSHDRHRSDAQELVTNWVSSNAAALAAVMKMLVATIRQHVDEAFATPGHAEDRRARESSIQGLVEMARAVLRLPVVGSTAESQALRAAYEAQLARESSFLRIRELLELLTFGMVKVSADSLRQLKDSKDRVEVVLQVYSSNPSHYKLSAKARDWLVAHGQRHDDDDVLDGVMALARLLHVEKQRLKIVVKAAHAALYCLDYDTSFRLVSTLLDELPHQAPTAAVDPQETRQLVSQLLSLVLDIATAASFQSWSKKIQLCRAVLCQPFVAAELFSHPAADLLLDNLQKLEAIQALATELGLQERDLQSRREVKSMSDQDVVLKEMEIVVELLREEAKDRPFILRVLQKGFLVLSLSHSDRRPLTSPPSSPRHRSSSRAELVRDSDALWDRLVKQMSVVAFQQAQAELQRGSDAESERGFASQGFAYLLLMVQRQPEGLKALWETELRPLLVPSVEDSAVGQSAAVDELLVAQFHHFFLFAAASIAADESIGDIQELVARVNELKSSSAASRAAARAIARAQADSEDVGSIEDDAAERTPATRLPPPQQALVDTLVDLAAECERCVAAHKKSQEMEEMSAFFNVELDVERFATDATYRLEMLRAMASKPEHFRVATQFAAKYGVDEYECVLAYLRHALLLPTTRLAAMTADQRQEQLERALRSEANGDVLEQALQRPAAFGAFLLGANEGIYDALPGTDHIGILLVLRMVLECSKRMAQAGATTHAESKEIAFPLAKPLSDRVTLLFMCLKRLKEVAAPASTTGAPLYPNFKQVCGAMTSRELLHAPPNAALSREIAVDAITPFLNGKTVKMLTKILQRVHQVGTSAMVLIFLDHMLSQIWAEQRHSALSMRADLASYAYESCVPFLSVLASDHVMLFHRCFVSLREDAPSINSDEFYGRELESIGRFAEFLSVEKRMDIVSDSLSLLQTRLKATSDEDEGRRRRGDVDALSVELVTAAFWFVVDAIQTNALFTADASAWLDDWKALARDWLLASLAAKTEQEDRGVSVFATLCEHTTSFELATLAVELALSLTAPPEAVRRTVEDLYRRGVSDAVARVTDSKLEILEAVVATWATDLSGSTGKRNDSNAAMAELCAHLEALDKANGENSSRADEVYERVLARLAAVASPSIARIVEARRAAHQDSSSAQRVVVAQWRSIVASYEDQKDFIVGAVLHEALLSHLGAASTSSSDAQLQFGLRVKAVCQWLVRCGAAPVSSAASAVLSIPSMEVLGRFESDVLEALLEPAASSQRAEKAGTELTTAAACLLQCYDCVVDHETEEPARSTWRQERDQATLSRLSADFGIARTTDNEKYLESRGQENDRRGRLWSRLLLGGAWEPTQLDDWYCRVAFSKLGDAQVIAEFVASRGDMNPLSAILLLLRCPFADVRERHERQIVLGSQVLLADAQLASSTKRRLLELLALRVDMRILLQTEGFEAHLLALYLSPTPASRKERRLSLLAWTSTPEYFVCRLLSLREFAQAGRVVCALWQAHPLLWDLENARLLLGSFLRSLQRSSDTRAAKKSSDVHLAIATVRRLIAEGFQKEFF